MIVRNALLGAAGALAATAVVIAWTPQQQAGLANLQVSAGAYQAKLAGACAVAMTLAPLAPQIAPWIAGGCASEAAIAKLALDPTSLQWLQGLAFQVKGAA